MDKRNQEKQIRIENEENWLDDLMERQQEDLEIEEKILGTVPNRLRHKYLDEDEE